MKMFTCDNFITSAILITHVSNKVISVFLCLSGHIKVRMFTSAETRRHFWAIAIFMRMQSGNSPKMNRAMCRYHIQHLQQ